MIDSYFYAPLAANRAVFKCRGIATDANRVWFLAANPGAVEVIGYLGDKLDRRSLEWIMALDAEFPPTVGG